MSRLHSSFRPRDPDKLRIARARMRERRKRLEAAAAPWGLSTRRRRPTPDGWRQLHRRERLCRECIEALQAGGEDAAVVAALGSLALAEWEAVVQALDREFGRGADAVWRCAPARDDMARIEYALDRFPPREKDGLAARRRLALITWGPTLDADLVLAAHRVASGFDRSQALPCDDTLRALCEALPFVFRADHAWRRQGAGGGR
jgi:hypothetical protein